MTASEKFRYMSNKHAQNYPLIHRDDINQERDLVLHNFRNEADTALTSTKMFCSFVDAVRTNYFGRRVSKYKLERIQEYNNTLETTVPSFEDDIIDKVAIEQISESARSLSHDQRVAICDPMVSNSRTVRKAIKSLQRKMKVEV